MGSARPGNASLEVGMVNFLPNPNSMVYCDPKFMNELVTFFNIDRSVVYDCQSGDTSLNDEPKF
ncbi:MAG: hypothetical protein Fur006_27890 [Coleofasciculaceae cyanobacterium]